MAFAIHLRNTGLDGGYGLPACDVNAGGRGGRDGWWVKAAVVDVVQETRADAEAALERDGHVAEVEEGMAVRRRR